MTSGHCVREGKWIRKRTTSRTPHVLTLTLALRSAGVRTPKVIPDRDNGHLRIAWCSGQRADVFLARRHTGTSVVEDLARVLSPLAALHRVSPLPKVDAHDPWRRIDPRIPLLTGTLRRRMEALRLHLVSALAALPASSHRLLHGDLHLGQILVPEDEEAWLLDLDDVAVGVREADFGNLAAYLATSIDTGLPSGEAYRHAERLVAAAAYTASGEPARFEHMRLHGAVALLRRFLKLYERGAPARFVGAWIDSVERMVRP